MNKHTETRRSFLKKSALAAPMVLSARVVARGANYVSPNEKVNIGLIGCGNRCKAVVSGGMEYPEFQMVAVADCFEPQTRKILRSLQGELECLHRFPEDDREGESGRRR